MGFFRRTAVGVAAPGNADIAASTGDIVFSTGSPTLGQGLKIENDGEIVAGSGSAVAKFTVDGVIALLEQGSAPSATSNYGKLYTKTDNKLYYKDDLGAETNLLAVAAGGDFSDGGEAGTADRSLGNTDAFKLDFLTNNLPRITILSGGNVGIGVTPAAESLELSGALLLGTAAGTANGTLRWTGSDFEGRKGGSWVSLTAGGIGGDFADGGEAGGADRSLGNTDNFKLDLLTNNSPRITILGGGDVGIGKIPTVALDVNGTINGTAYQLSGSGLFTSGTVFIDRETVSGTKNGVNVTFTIANTPVAGSEHIFLNGLLLEEGASEDYTISGSTITMVVAPQSDDTLFASYRK